MQVRSKIDPVRRIAFAPRALAGAGDGLALLCPMFVRRSPIRLWV
jgi:hypothetical protein